MICARSGSALVNGNADNNVGTDRALINGKREQGLDVNQWLYTIVAILQTQGITALQKTHSYLLFGTCNFVKLVHKQLVSII